MRKFNAILFLFSFLFSITPLVAAEDFEGSIKVPLNFYIIDSELSPQVDVNLEMFKIEELLTNVNTIWKQAGISFYSNSIEMQEPQLSDDDLDLLYSPRNNIDKRTRNKLLSNMCSVDHSAKDVNICVIGNSLSPKFGGLALRWGNGSSLVLWPTEKLGVYDANAATLAHELGHTLGLKHNQEKEIFLMRGRGNNMRRNWCCEGILLTKKEISIARKTAYTLLAL